MNYGIAFRPNDRARIKGKTTTIRFERETYRRGCRIYIRVDCKRRQGLLQPLILTVSALSGHGVVHDWEKIVVFRSAQWVYVEFDNCKPKQLLVEVTNCSGAAECSFDSWSSR
jgi:hypothetical protein